jgi:hypothetical protein
LSQLRPTHTALERTSSLQSEIEILSPLEAIALSDGRTYSERFRQHLAWRQKEYLTKDLIYSTLAPSLVIGLVAVFTGDVTPVTFLWAALSYFALFASFAVKHAVQAPGEIDAAIRNRLGLKEKALAVEKARNAEPQLVGTIICLNHEIGFGSTEGGIPYDCYLTLHLSVTNGSAMGSMATGFRLDLLWSGGEFPGVNIPVKGYFLKRDYKNPPSWEPRHRTEWKPLEQFPLNTEITNTNHQEGWLRFSVGAFPREAVTQLRVKDDVMFRLQAFDHKRVLRPICEGYVVSLPGCGTIQMPKKIGLMQHGPDGPYVEWVDDFNGL